MEWLGQPSSGADHGAFAWPRPAGHCEDLYEPLNWQRFTHRPKPLLELDFCGPPPHIGSVTALLFDTLRLSRTLRDKGHFTTEQAEALAEALGEASQGDLATRADLAEVRAEIAEVRTELAELRTEFKTEIAQLRTELKTEIAAVRTELLKWIISAIGFQTVVILGALISIIKILAK